MLTCGGAKREATLQTVHSTGEDWSVEENLSSKIEFGQDHATRKQGNGKVGKADGKDWVKSGSASQYWSRQWQSRVSSISRMPCNVRSIGDLR